jgi:hypothetical protein
MKLASFTGNLNAIAQKLASIMPVQLICMLMKEKSVLLILILLGKKDKLNIVINY